MHRATPSARLALVLLGALAFAAAAPTPAPRPHVVILLTDDQGTLDANCYGSTDLKTPHMDRLAADGIRFTQAYAHTVCCPARAALFTGRHPQRGGVIHWTQGDRKGSDQPKINLALEEVTLAEVLKSAGYRTALFGKWHLGAQAGPIQWIFPGPPAQSKLLAANPSILADGTSVDSLAIGDACWHQFRCHPGSRKE